MHIVATQVLQIQVKFVTISGQKTSISYKTQEDMDSVTTGDQLLTHTAAPHHDTKSKPLVPAPETAS